MWHLFTWQNRLLYNNIILDNMFLVFISPLYTLFNVAMSVTTYKTNMVLIQIRLCSNSLIKMFIWILLMKKNNLKKILY